MFFIGEKSGTRYEIGVMKIDNENCPQHGRYIISLLNFGECFELIDLQNTAHHIFYKSKIFGKVDCINIQNTIAENMENVPTIKIEEL
ncbi:hypothetical protein CON15_19865 [Bacillus cereus]|uniref:YopX protein domain-containing protein n=1 Tax=Bacillus thuringiensis TaxID=1428 RepID=A0AB36VGC0_BACTU|nr:MULTISPECIES: hypothetical protein [Bacillus cereus group]PDZ55799.1 hypothetical protein CON15_19865 [Bacillus cereus]PFO26125.1 hypothetical protein COJ78_28910 [Bacillus thuringiensis]PFS40419.1 hypothetical protein COK48_00820 [Bacillus thuringiensis]PFS58124.1 hypothetical protein COK64_17235 [Bacillus thuringiensis]PGZ05038.1 hypothetical protein COE48_05490 [Bacillus thuringiensis]